MHSRPADFDASDTLPSGSAMLIAPPQSLPVPPSVSALIADWHREAAGWAEWAPDRKLLRALRDHQSVRASRLPHHLFRRWVAVLRHRLWSVVSGAEIPLGCRIEGGLLMPHPNGIVLHPDVRIGPNCLILQQVTIGAGGSVPGVPVVAGHVDIGAGAKVLGGITIGPHAKIGANAVVLCDVPAGATAVGIPARIIRLQAGDS